MVQVKKKINGTTWTIQVVTTKQMNKIIGKDGSAVGLCVPSEKIIYLDQIAVDYNTVLHELFHAYVSDLHLDDTNNVPLADVEEIFASLFAAKGEKMISQAKKIVKDLNKKMEE